MSRYIDADSIKLEKGFFEKVDNVPKFYEWLGKQPTIDAVPVVNGEWKPLKGMQPPELHGKHYCSNCDHIIHLALNGGVYNYCPNCGAKMDGGKDDADS